MTRRPTRVPAVPDEKVLAEILRRTRTQHTFIGPGRADLEAALGLKRPTIIAYLSRLQREGLIEVRGSYHERRYVLTAAGLALASTKKKRENAR